jgi:trk system potassium uptake protein TrkH
MSIGDKLLNSFFQSVTVRTAGFAAVDQALLTDASKAVSMALMLVGGSSGSTAGGVKTVTITVLIASAIASIKNRNEVILFHRTLAKPAVIKAIAVVVTSFAIMFTSTILLSAVTPNASALDIAYETVSATATVGLTRNLTSSLNTIGKLIIITTMYLGRIGPIALAIAFKMRKVNEYIITNPTEDISVG